MARPLSHRLTGTAGISAALVLAAGTAAAQPNLVPVLNNPMNASVGVQNTGKTAAGPSHLTINCTRFGQADGGCPDMPGLAAYADPAYPNRVVIEVPALEPGASFNHNLAFWAAIPWTPGTYVFDARADAGNAVAESNEANNTTQSSYTEQPGAGVAPPQPLPLATKPAAGATVATLGKADIMSTTLGSFIGGDHSAWNQVQTVRNGTISQTQYGLDGDECVVPSKVRLMNIGDVNSGIFRLSVYVDGELRHLKQTVTLAKGENKWIPYDLRLNEGANDVEIRLDDLDQVPEKDETNNIYHTTVRVPFDCDGIGVLAPARTAGGQTKPQQPAAPAKPQRLAPVQPDEPKRLQLRAPTRPTN
jgi:hypothetical protein